MDNKQQVLFLTFDHPNLVTENFTTVISSAFTSNNFEVIVVSLSKNLNDQFSTVDVKRLALVFSL